MDAARTAKAKLQAALRARGIAPEGMSASAMQTTLEDDIKLRGNKDDSAGPFTHQLLWAGYARPLVGGKFKYESDYVEAVKKARVDKTAELKRTKTEAKNERDSARSERVLCDVTIPSFDALFTSAFGDHLANELSLVL